MDCSFWQAQNFPNPNFAFAKQRRLLWMESNFLAAQSRQVQKLRSLKKSTARFLRQAALLKNGGFSRDVAVSAATSELD